MIDLDHTYFTDQPLQQKHSRKVTTLKKKVNCQQNTLSRKTKIKNMKELLKSLKEKRLITNEHLTNLSENVGDVAKNLFKNHIENSKKDSTYAQHYNL